MNMIRQLAMIAALCLAGEFLSILIPIAIPGSIIGLILLLILFLSHAVKPSALDTAGEWLLSNMAVFFVPAAVSLLSEVSVLAENGLAIFVICIVSTVLTFAATAYTVKLVSALQNRGRRRSK